MNNKFKFLPLLVFIFFSSCADVKISSRSGTIDDDYIGQDLAQDVQPFRQALLTSNKVLKLFAEDRIEDIYEDYYEKQVTGGLSREKFRDMFRKLFDEAGKIKEYKEMQWAFHEASHDHQDYLFLRKIVVCENDTLNFLFIFPMNSDYTKLTGLRFKKRMIVLAPGKL